MDETSTDKPEQPVWVGPSAQFDIDALLDRMRRDRRDKEATKCPRERSTN
jgi:hypothetical protein